MPDIYAIGAGDVVAPFKIIGAELLSGVTAEEVSRALAAVAADPEAVLALVTEESADLAPDAVAELRAKQGPAVLVIPSHRGASGRSLQEIRELVARAVGVDLMAGQE